MFDITSSTSHRRRHAVASMVAARFGRAVAVGSTLATLTLATPAIADTWTTEPAAPLSGSYVAPPLQHPYVYETKARAIALLNAAKTDPVSAMALKRLTVAVQQLLPSAATFEAPTDGCDIVPYMNSFSLWPTGAAPAAARLAYYAYLTSLNQGYGDPVLAAQAKSVAQTILLNWAQTGFQINGTPMTSLTNYCSSVDDKSTGWASVALQMGRGMVNYVLAADLLNDGTQTSDWLSATNAFINRQLNVEIQGLDWHFIQAPNDCSRYENQESTAIHSLLSMARYVGRADVIESLAGHDVTATNPNTNLLLGMANTVGRLNLITGILSMNNNLLPVSWGQQIEGNIYGTNDTPRSCFVAGPSNVNTYKQDNVVAPGEVVDRYRAEPYQAFGYTSGSITSLEMGAFILESSGFKASAYVGNKGQSLETALDYYGWYAENFLSFDATAIPTSGYTYPNFAQYAGDMYTTASGSSINSDSSAPWLLGAKFYPNDTVIAGVLANYTAMGSTYNIVPFSAGDILGIAEW